MEEWRTVRDWPNYVVSSQGQVYSTRYNRYMTLSVYRGYLRVTLSKDGKYTNMLVHRLVALEFVPGWFEGAVVNHIDGNKQNNTPENLEWITSAQNILHARETGLIRHGPRGPNVKWLTQEEHDLRYLPKESE